MDSFRVKWIDENWKEHTKDFELVEDAMFFAFEAIDEGTARMWWLYEVLWDATNEVGLDKLAQSPSSVWK